MGFRRIAYIDNLTGSDITIVPGCVAIASTKSFVLDNYTMLSSVGMQKLSEQYHYNNLAFYDEYDEIIENEDFFNYVSIINNNFSQHGSNFYKLYLLLSDDVRHRYIDYSITPKSVDYKTDLYKRIHPKYTFDKGFLVEAEYFEFLDVTQNEFGIDVYNFSNPILKVEIEYEIGADGYAFRRFTTRSWTRANGEYDSDTKITTKYYNKKTAREEGIRRRTNIIDNILLDTVGMLMINQQITVFQAEILSLPTLNYIDTDVNKYLKGNIEPLITTMSTIDVTQFSNGTNGTPNWIDENVPGMEITLRQYIIAKLMEATLS